MIQLADINITILDDHGGLGDFSSHVPGYYPPIPVLIDITLLQVNDFRLVPVFGGLMPGHCALISNRNLPALNLMSSTDFAEVGEALIQFGKLLKVTNREWLWFSDDTASLSMVGQPGQFVIHLLPAPIEVRRRTDGSCIRKNARYSCCCKRWNLKNS